jgi:hypothetical protein
MSFPPAAAPRAGQAPAPSGTGRGCEVVNHDADVVHPLDRHVFDSKEPDSGRGARGRAVFSGISFGWRTPVTPRQEADLGERTVLGR